MNVAVLIDAENVLPSFADQIFAAAVTEGEVRVREIYGAASALTSWVEPVLKYAIHSNLTIKAIKGKNTSDISLVIGAMDLLIQGGIDTVLIVSSDSDFSTLSVRLRGAGLKVIGMGTEKTNPLWRTACSDFVCLQAVQSASQTKTIRSAPAAKTVRPAPAVKQPASVPGQVNQPPARTAQTHNERVTVIRSYITNQLEANGGRLTVNMMFQGLQTLPEYQVDQQGSKRKPLSYLKGLFSDAFRFYESANGVSWIALPGMELEPEKGTEDKGNSAAVQPPELPELPSVDQPVGNQTANLPPEVTAETADVQAAQIPMDMDILMQGQISPVETSPTEVETAEGSEKSGRVYSSTNEPESFAVLNSSGNMEKKPDRRSDRHNGAGRGGKGKSGAAGNRKIIATNKDTTAPQKSDISLHQLGLSPRALSSLIAQGYQTLGEVASLSDEQLMEIKNIGIVTVDQIRKAAKEML